MKITVVQYFAYCPHCKDFDYITKNYEEKDNVLNSFRKKCFWCDKELKYTIDKIEEV